MPVTIRSFAVLLSSLLTATLCAQLGGQTAFRLLDIPASARAAALGGNYIAVKDADLNLGVYNPALLDSATGQQIALSFLPYFDGIKVGYAAYAHHLDSSRITLAASVQYLDYGSFQRTDEVGEVLGEFRAGEQVLQVGAGYPVDSLFSVGANIKYLNSALESYRSSAFGVDLTGVFHKRKLGLTIAGAVRNIGRQLTTYTDQREKLPMQVQLGITYKFRHAPFRLGLMMEQLQRWDLTYDDPNAQVVVDPTTGEVIEDEVTTVDKALLHLVPSAEILLSKSFMLRIAYNTRRRQELVIADKPSAVGLSFGVGLRVSKFQIAYGFSQLHLAGISNTLSLGVRFADFKRAEG